MSFTEKIIYKPELITEKITSSEQLSGWRDVANTLINWCKDVRKDTIAIIDAPRNISMRGNITRISTYDPDSNFNNTILPQLKYISGLNSSYAALYDGWHKTHNTFTGTSIWLPPSIQAAGVYVKLDLSKNYWEAPAGMNNAILQNITAISYTPKQDDANSLYNKSINFSIYNSKYNVIYLDGQKTTQVVASAFDRINVRRLFLRLNRFTKDTLQKYLYQPHTAELRNKVVADIEPTLKKIRASGGIYDFKVICNLSNNSPESIDRNELNVTIMIKPSKIIEYIIVDVICTRTSMSFSERL